ncbi:MAG: HAD hydrolase-like protein [Pseudomonadota bacterium]|nr:HAD hydrolase-like protein [Pseudomonadota bacterium]
MRYDLVIFDFDGTLADSAEWTLGILNQVAERYGFRQVSEAETAMLRGWDNRAIIRYLGVPAWKLPLIANHMRKLAARDAGQIRLFPGVDALLARLSGAGVRLAIVSSNAEENVRRILGPANSALIAHYACGASIFGKAAKFRQVLRASGIARSRTLCIGDEARDIEAAVAERLACGAVTWGYATPELLRAREPTLLFRSLDEIGAAVTL